MELSLFYFANEVGPSRNDGSYRLLLDGARFADRSGFSAIWMPERHFHPFGGIYPNPAVTAAALATITERIQLRAGSVVAPLHHPIRIAEEWAVVDNLSGGRVGISFAPGWHHVDFVLAPDRFADRKAHVVTAVETVRALWRGEETTCTDGNGGAARVRVYPRPVQPDLPVWITTSGNRETFEVAGKLGANVLTHGMGQRDDELRQKIARYREVLAAGHPGSRGHVTLMLHTFLGTDLAAVRELVREPLLRYLASSFDLRMGTPAKHGRVRDAHALGEREIGLAVRRAFDRYFDTQGLFGPPERCVGMVERFAAVGIDEIACLIDFGPDLAATMTSLELLARLCDRVRERT
jgi:natural product biosynthesis luciferase-like monooxygenase protein